MIICMSEFTSTVSYCKFGMHIYFPNVVVDRSRAIHIVNRIIQTLEQECALPMNMKWDQVIDWDIYNHPKLRMLYSNKQHKNDPVYVPKLFINGKTNMIDSHKTKKMSHLKFESLIYTSLLYNARDDKFFDTLTEPYYEQQEELFPIKNPHMNQLIKRIIENSPVSFCLDQKDKQHGKHKADWLYGKKKNSNKKQNETQIKDENMLRVVFYLILLYGKKMSNRNSINIKKLIQKKKPYSVQSDQPKSECRSLIFINPSTGIQTNQDINFESTYGNCILNNCFYNNESHTISASIYCKEGTNDRFCYNKGETHMSAQIYFVFSKKKKTYKQDCFSSHCNHMNCIYKAIPENCFDILFPQI